MAGEWRSLLVCLCDAEGAPCADGAHAVTLRAAPLARDTAAPPAAAAPPPAAAPPAAGWARARDALLPDQLPPPPRDAPPSPMAPPSPLAPLRPDELRVECAPAAGGQYALRYYLTRAVPHALSIHALAVSEPREQGRGAHGDARHEYGRWLAGECEGAASAQKPAIVAGPRAGHKAGRALQRAVAWGERAGPGGAAARRQAWSSGGEEAEGEGPQQQRQQQQQEEERVCGGGGLEEGAVATAVRSFELEVLPASCCLRASAQGSRLPRQLPFGSAIVATVTLTYPYP